MNIAVFHNLPNGGALRTVYEQVKGLSKFHTIDMYCFNKPDYKNIKNYLNNIYINSFEIDKDKKGLIKRLKEDYKNFIILKYVHRNIASEIDSKKYDLVLVHPDKWTESPFILRYLKTNNVYHCHELLRIVYEQNLKVEKSLSFYKYFYEIITRYIRKRIDYINARSALSIITSSNYINKKVSSEYKKTAFTIYLGVDLDIFRATLRRKKHVLFIGKRDVIKGYDTLRRINLHLGSLLNVTFFEIGFSKGQKLETNDINLAKIYSNAICLVCVSRKEPFGLTALESMACKTPVLAVNEGGYRETVVDGVTGYLLPRNPKIFVEKIKYLMENPDIARKMGKAGREHVKKNFTWKKHVDLLEKHLIRIAKF